MNSTLCSTSTSQTLFPEELSEDIRLQVTCTELGLGLPVHIILAGLYHWFFSVHLLHMKITFSDYLLCSINHIKIFLKFLKSPCDFRMLNPFMFECSPGHPQSL